ncbi:MAG: hypothetical protein F4X17_14965 [Gemmatimonadetes bacterium]|nr:hypothetical protein [Gemmatimonadota bacterium]
MNLQRLIPTEFQAEFAELVSQVDDDSVSPTLYLAKVDKFFERLCGAEGVDFEAVYGDLRVELAGEISAEMSNTNAND